MTMQSKQSKEFDYMQFLNWSSPSDQKISDLDLLDNAQGVPCPSPQKKASLKNKYANNLKESSLENCDQPDLKMESPEVQPLAENTETEKKIKNKAAAKESRDRKKMYITILQKQTEALQRELAKTNQQLENCRAEILKNYFASSQHIAGSFSRKMIHAFKKIKKLMKQASTEEHEDELNFVIDSLFYRFAAMGKERQNSINGAYNQIIKIGVPVVQRYILWAARNQCHIFQKFPLDTGKNQGAESWFRQMRALLDDLPQRQMQQINQFKKAISQMQIKVRRVLVKLSKTKKKMKEKCQALDNQIAEIRQIMTPIQMANFLLFQEHYRYWDDIRHHERMWQDEEQEGLGSPKKHFKINQN